MQHQVHMQAGENATETLRALQQIYGDGWYNSFKNRQETVEDEPRSGRPSTFVTPGKIEEVR